MAVIPTFEAVHDSAAIQRVYDLACIIWPEHYAALIGLDQVTYMLKTVHSPQAIQEQIRDGMVYELLNTGQDCGYVAYQVQADCCFLSKLYVCNEHRGQGLGSAAMQRIIDYAHGSHCDKLQLTVNRGNDNSIAFYKAWGWQQLKDIVIDIGGGYVMDDHLMQLDLRQQTRTVPGRK
jgi:GNAT superfamily N-acetyltransferase